jgi:tryptophan synthase beta subunit
VEYCLKCRPSTDDGVGDNNDVNRHDGIVGDGIVGDGIVGDGINDKRRQLHGVEVGGVGVTSSKDGGVGVTSSKVGGVGVKVGGVGKWGSFVSQPLF